MRELKDILEDFDNLRQNFRHFTVKGDVNRAALIEYQGRFVDLKSDLTYWKSHFLNEWTRRDDKAATAIKYRLAGAISRGEYTDHTGKVLDKCSLSIAEKIAAGTKEYQEFIQQRSHYKEYASNISDRREDISSYINEIKDRIK